MSDLITQMEKNSGVTFSQAQVALARQWIGQDQDSDQKTVTVTLPDKPTLEGLIVSDKTQARTETVAIPESEEAARFIVAQFESGSNAIRGDEDVADTVSQHMLNDKTGLKEEIWLGTPEEELNA
jgi:phospholipase D1/2